MAREFSPEVRPALDVRLQDSLSLSSLLYAQGCTYCRWPPPREPHRPAVIGGPGAEHGRGEPRQGLGPIRESWVQLCPGSSARVDIRNLTGREPWSGALPSAPLFLVPWTSAVIPAWGNRVPSPGDAGCSWRISIVVAGSWGCCWPQPGRGQGCHSSHLGAQDSPGILGMELESPPHSIPVSPP